MERVLVWMKKKRKKDAELQWEEEGVLVLSALGSLSLSLDDEKAWKEEKMRGFNGS